MRRTLLYMRGGHAWRGLELGRVTPRDVRRGCPSWTAAGRCPLHGCDGVRGGGACGNFSVKEMSTGDGGSDDEVRATKANVSVNVSVNVLLALVGWRWLEMSKL